MQEQKGRARKEPDIEFQTNQKCISRHSQLGEERKMAVQLTPDVAESKITQIEGARDRAVTTLNKLNDTQQISAEGKLAGRQCKQIRQHCRPAE